MTRRMAEGIETGLSPAVDTPWQQADAMPAEVADAAEARRVQLTAAQWADLSELDRFCLCKLVRPGHDHHNLAAAFSEVLG